MRISDWITYVCSSDLPAELRHRHERILDDDARGLAAFVFLEPDRRDRRNGVAVDPGQPERARVGDRNQRRSEERRGGEEGVSTCRSWRWPYISKKTMK